MEKILKYSWTDALRSGDFQQGKGKLKNKSPETYCPIGVLGTIIGIDLMDAHAFGTILLGQVGLSDDEQNDIIIKNEAGGSFSEIADWIDNNL